MSRNRQNAKGKTVYVIDDNISQAIKKLRRILKQNNIFAQLKQRQVYVKPSVIRKKRKSLKKWKCEIWNEQRNKKSFTENK